MTFGKYSLQLEERWFALFKYALYYVIGGAIVLSNGCIISCAGTFNVIVTGLILLATVRHPALLHRKECACDA